MSDPFDIDRHPETSGAAVNGRPESVDRALAGADRAGFGLSCDDRVGRLLAVLAASVPAGGRVLELGTGVGVGTAWIVEGLAGRGDVELVTVEVDTEAATLARTGPWPDHVRFLTGDVVALLPSLGRFDLVFADAQGGKWDRLDLSVDALAEGGFLLVDDMKPRPGWSAEQAAHQAQVRDDLLGNASLTACEMDWATGVILCCRRPLAEP